MATIKTITCHDVYNHGASLQAYALQRYLTEQGHDVEIIDYKPAYLSGHYKLWKVSNPKWDRNLLLKLIYLTLKLPGRLMALKRKKAFDYFTSKCLKLTPTRYSSNEKLKTNSPKADIYIAGSDQIWNTIFENGKDPAFYLDFVPPGKKRISYAASFATNKIVDGYEEFVKIKINNLDFISVREHSGVQLLETLGIKRAVHVVDPVFLLSAEKWNKIGTTPFSEKYLVVYDTEKNSILKNIALKVAQKLDLPVFSISASHLSYAKKNFHRYGPQMFVSLIKNAEYVISNSFHGTAFALIYKKNFCVVNRSEAINSRMLNLLQSLGIENRLVGINTNIDEIIKPIDYMSVQAQLSQFIDQSEQFLIQAIKA